MIMINQKKWIKLIQKKSDEHAANELVNHHYQSIYAFVYKQTLNKELSMDLTQEIFISMLQSIGSFDEQKASFATWLYRIAANRIVDYFRSKHYSYDRARDSVDELEISEETDFTLQLEYKEEVQRITQLINELDFQAQQVVRLKLFAEQTFSEISVTLDISESSIKTKYYATIRKIKKRMEAQRNE